MEDENFLHKISSLSDLELAFLLSLVAREHCLISTPAPAVDELIDELRLIASKTFHLETTVVSCHPHITLDEFASALLLASSPIHSDQRSASPHLSRSPHPDTPASQQYHNQQQHHPYHQFQYRRQPQLPSSNLGPGPRTTTTTTTTITAPHGPTRIANVVLAKHLDRAPRVVQIQALELLRTRRIFTRTAVHAAPKQFLFAAVLEGSSPGRGARVTPHLNDFLYFAHWHDPAQGFANLEEWRDATTADEGGGSGGPVARGGKVDGGDGGSTTSSNQSVVRRNPSQRRKTPGILGSRFTDGIMGSNDDNGGDDDEGYAITEGDISYLAQLSERVRVDVDVVRYQMNVVTFLRIHRAVAGPVSPTATKHLEQLMKSLAPLQGLDFVTASLVAMAARKVYLHRIDLVPPEKERSMQWGSELAAVEEVLKGVGPQEVIEEVLDKVAAPV